MESDCSSPSSSAPTALKQRLLACGLNDHYRQIFELTRLDEAIAIHTNEAGALQAAA